MKFTVVTLLAASFCHSFASTIPFSSERHSLTPRQNTSCANTATSRSCWGDYSIDTDWYSVVPDTGVTREVRVLLKAIPNLVKSYLLNSTGSQLRTLLLPQMVMRGLSLHSTGPFQVLLSSLTGVTTS